MQGQKEKLPSRRLRFPYSILRNFVELASFLLLNILAFKYVYPFVQMDTVGLPVPILLSLKSTYSVVGGALDFVQIMFSIPIFPLVPFAAILVVGSVFGRLFCGWLCPIGFIQDLMLKMKGYQSKVSLRKHLTLKKLKFVVLIVVLFFSTTLYASLYLDPESDYKAALGPFARGVLFPIQPETTLFSTIPWMIQAGAESGLLDFGTLESPGYLMLLGLALLAVLFAGAYMIPWFWCRYFCPTGALMGIFMRFSFLGLGRDPSRCTKCGECVEICPMQIRILELPWEKFNDPECTLCLECVGACPSGALAPKFP